MAELELSVLRRPICCCRYVNGVPLGPEEEVTLCDGDSISFGRSESRQYPHIFVLDQLQQLLSACTPSPSPARPTPIRPTPMHVDLEQQLKTEPSLGTQQTAQPVRSLLNMLGRPCPSQALLLRLSGLPNHVSSTIDVLCQLAEAAKFGDCAGA